MLEAVRAIALSLLVSGCSPSTKEHTPQRGWHDDARSTASIGTETVRVSKGWFRSGCAILPSSIPEAGVVQCACMEPPRDLWIGSFDIDRFETTVAEYSRCIRANACASTTSESIETSTDDTAALVTFEQASAYCAWRHRRLPTESEWEKAARGSDGRPYPWGTARPDCSTAAVREDDLDALWPPTSEEKSIDCPFRPPGRVGQHPVDRSPYGAWDMGGNVPEWTTDIAVSTRRDWRYDADCPRFDRPSTVKFLEVNPINPRGPSAETRAEFLSDQWPNKPEVRTSFPLHVARSGIATRSIFGFGSPDGDVAGVRCASDVDDGGPPRTSAKFSASYKVSLRRASTDGSYIIDSEPLP